MCAWTRAGVGYQITETQPGQGVLVASGPGVRIRTAAVPLDDGAAVEWIAWPDGRRTARAEQLLRV